MPRVGTANTEYRQPHSIALGIRDTHNDLPTQWCGRITTRFPIPARWAKLVHGANRLVRTIRDLHGRYISVDHSCDLLYGSIVVAHTHTRAGNPVIIAYLFMPHVFWYRLPIPPVQYTTDWAAVIGPQLCEYLALTLRQRIVRACNEVITTVSNYVDTSERETVLTQFTDVRNEALENVTNATPDAIRRSFDNWLARVRATANLDEQVIWTAIRQALSSTADNELLQQVLRLCADLDTSLVADADISLSDALSIIHRCLITVLNVAETPLYLRLQLENNASFMRMIHRDSATRTLSNTDLPALLESIRDDYDIDCTNCPFESLATLEYFGVIDNSTFEALCAHKTVPREVTQDARPQSRRIVIRRSNE